MSMNNALLQGSDRITHLCAHIKKQYRISKWRNMSLYVIMRLWAKYYVLTTRHIKRLDTKYIKEWTPALDVKILFKTVKTVLGKEGSM